MQSNKKGIGTPRINRTAPPTHTHTHTKLNLVQRGNYVCEVTSACISPFPFTRPKLATGPMNFNPIFPGSLPCRFQLRYRSMGVSPYSVFAEHAFYFQNANIACSLRDFDCWFWRVRFFISLVGTWLNARHWWGKIQLLSKWDCVIMTSHSNEPEGEVPSRRVVQ